MGINIQNVTYNYSARSNPALKDLNLNIDEKDEFIFLIGKTGSGKSTLLQLMNTLLLPKCGNIFIKDRNVVLKYVNKKVLNTPHNREKFGVTGKGIYIPVSVPVYNPKLKDLRSYCGLVFQFPEYQLFESTVEKDVMFGPKNFGVSEREALSRARQSLKAVGLDEKYYQESPFNLSGGQMRKVALAGILAMNPDILMLDEPTAGLDPFSKEELMKVLVELNTVYHKSIIIVSHDMDLVSTYAKRVLVMNHAEKVFDGPVRDLFKDKEFLHKHNLDYSYASRCALKLKEAGLIDFDNVPLTFDELERLITGDKHE